MREEISRLNKRRYSLDYSKDEIVVTCGGSEAIDIALRCCINPGDEVIVLEPCYVCYEPDMLLAGGVPVSPFLPADDLLCLLELFLSLCKLLVLGLALPSSDSGKACLLPVRKSAGCHTVINAHLREFLPFHELRDALPFHIRGVCLFLPSHIISCYMVTPIRFFFSSLSIFRSWYTCFEPRGAFYVFPDIRKFGMTSEKFATDLLEKEHVVVVPGTAFGESGEGFVRISYAYSLEALKEAIRRIEQYLEHFL